MKMYRDRYKHWAPLFLEISGGFWISPTMDFRTGCYRVFQLFVGFIGVSIIGVCRAKSLRF